MSRCAFWRLVAGAMAGWLWLIAWTVAALTGDVALLAGLAGLMVSTLGWVVISAWRG